MLSFALLNFYKPYIILPKTYKYYTLIKLLNSGTLFFFLKFNLTTFYTLNSYLIPKSIDYFFRIHFIKPVWYFFKKLNLKQSSNYTNNLYPSLAYSFIKSNLNNITTASPSNKQLPLIKTNLFYARPIQVIKFAIHKHLYNTFIYYNIMFLLESNLSTLTVYNLKYSFIFVKSIMWSYTFLNQFYIKVSHV